MKLIFLGAQGSGKGTEAKIISEILQIPPISSGDLLRASTGELKEQIHNIINKGDLIPDELIAQIIKKRISEPDCKKGFILDGFPRTLNQVKLLEKITRINKVIEINISDKEAVKRLLGRVICKKCKANYNLITSPKPKNPKVCGICGGRLKKRADDNESAIKKRLETYHKETKPLISHYKKQGILTTVNGEQEIDPLAKEILEKITLNPQKTC